MKIGKLVLWVESGKIVWQKLKKGVMRLTFPSIKFKLSTFDGSNWFSVKNQNGFLLQPSKISILDVYGICIISNGISKKLYEIILRKFLFENCLCTRKKLKEKFVYNEKCHRNRKKIPLQNRNLFSNNFLLFVSKSHVKSFKL